MKKILFVSSECVPFVKTGGLGDVVGALPKILNQKGCDARVVLPKFGAIPQQYKEQMRFVSHIYIKMNWRSQYCGIFELDHNGVKYYFIDNEFYFGSPTIYGQIYEDIERFAFFDKAVLAMLQVIDFFPDILHCNDWQAGMVPVLLRAHYSGDDRYRSMKSIMTIHNLKFQGVYDKKTIADVCELGPEYFTSDKLEFYKDASFLKGGMVYADYITTVSPTYAEEIKSDYFGERLNGLLNARSNSLCGIVNGISYDDWNSETDKFIYTNYGINNLVDGKNANKLALQRDLHFEENTDKLLIGMVTRLTGQKGMDLVECVLDSILANPNIQLVVLGTGEERYENVLRFFEWKYSGRVSAQIKFDNALSHKIYAACDAFLMPSLFEPCGLSQMISMRYGTLPIVRETGGLKDTVEPYNEYENTGTGYSFKNYNAHEMLNRIESAYLTFALNKDAWRAMQRRAMEKDFSWNVSADRYIELYNRL